MAHVWIAPASACWALSSNARLVRALQSGQLTMISLGLLPACPVSSGPMRNHMSAPQQSFAWAPNSWPGQCQLSSPRIHVAWWHQNAERLPVLWIAIAPERRSLTVCVRKRTIPLQTLHWHWLAMHVIAAAAPCMMESQERSGMSTKAWNTAKAGGRSGEYMNVHGTEQLGIAVILQQ